MAKAESINQNIGLTFDYVNHLVDNPQELGELPDKFVVEFNENLTQYATTKYSSPIRLSGQTRHCV